VRPSLELTSLHRLLVIVFVVWMGLVTGCSTKMVLKCNAKNIPEEQVLNEEYFKKTEVRTYKVVVVRDNGFWGMR
jgi:hypothetical protein